jgi:UPF0755 protein
MLADNIKLGKGEPVLVLVEPGTNAAEISRQISRMGLTSNPNELSRWFVKLAIDRSIRPGIYSILPGSPWEIARQIRDAVPEVFTVTILPGETYHEIIQKQGPLFEKAMEDDTLFPREIRNFLPLTPSARVAFLVPDTYSVSPSSKSCRELVTVSSGAWWKRIGSKAVSDGIDVASLFEKSIISSLVEKEARLDEERELIAGVIQNRLSRGMRLQIDATVVYAWSLKGVILNRVLFSDLELDSPYNTYIFSGLPPAPICVPSEESWKAALKPLDTPFLFYVAKPDGGHIFSTTYQEHLEAIRRARKEFDSINN